MSSMQTIPAHHKEHQHHIETMTEQFLAAGGKIKICKQNESAVVGVKALPSDFTLKVGKRTAPVNLINKGKK